MIYPPHILNQAAQSLKAAERPNGFGYRLADLILVACPEYQQRLADAFPEWINEHLPNFDDRENENTNGE